MKRFVFLCLFVTSLNADTLKECKSEKDKAEGCVFKEYYTNWILEAETPYKNGKIHGVAKYYYDNGNLRHEATYIDGEIQSLMRYFPDGDLAAETPYKNGKIHGVAKYYKYDGILEAEIPYQNWERNGVAKYYYDNGNIGLQIIYEDGKAISGICANGKKLTNAHLNNEIINDVSICRK